MPYFALSHQPTAQLRDGVPDIRGFEVRTRSDDARAGKVADVVIDQTGQPHFVDVDLGGLLIAKRVLLPATRVEVDGAARVAWVSGMTKDELKQLPSYDRDPSRIPDATAGVGAGAGAAASAVRGADVRGTNVRGTNVRGTTDDAVRLMLAEEALSIGRRQVPAGEVDVRKTVETERVRQTVPVMHEEVTVERRPATGMDAATAQVEVTEDEIRIPIFAEEVVVEKRVVAREEYIVRRRQVTETQTVEADLRRERLEVDRSGNVR